MDRSTLAGPYYADTEDRIRIKLPWGAAHEEERARRIAKGFDNVDVLPRMSLEEIARILAGAEFVVSVDTGLSHLTAALNRPNVTLYGPTDPGLIGGYGKNQLTCIAPEGKSVVTHRSASTNTPTVRRITPAVGDGGSARLSEHAEHR